MNLFRIQSPEKREHEKIRPYRNYRNRRRSAGYVAAIRAAQLGLSTACIDEWISPEGKSRVGGHLFECGVYPLQGLARLVRTLLSGGGTASALMVFKPRKLAWTWRP